jgi:hypothetical protein
MLVWSDVFPEIDQPSNRLILVMIWSVWSAHSPDALADLQRARGYFAARGTAVEVFTATDPGSLESDVARARERHRIDLPRIRLSANRLTLTGAQNQIPATLLFRDGRLIDRRLGAQTFDQLRRWIEGEQSSIR